MELRFVKNACTPQNCSVTDETQVRWDPTRELLLHSFKKKKKKRKKTDRLLLKSPSLSIFNDTHSSDVQAVALYQGQEGYRAGPLSNAATPLYQHTSSQDVTRTSGIQVYLVWGSVSIYINLDRYDYFDYCWHCVLVMRKVHWYSLQ